MNIEPILHIKEPTCGITSLNSFQLGDSEETNQLRMAEKLRVKIASKRLEIQINDLFNVLFEENKTTLKTEFQEFVENYTKDSPIALEGITSLEYYYLTELKQNTRILNQEEEKLKQDIYNLLFLRFSYITLLKRKIDKNIQEPKQYEIPEVEPESYRTKFRRKKNDMAKKLPNPRMLEGDEGYIWFLRKSFEKFRRLERLKSRRYNSKIIELPEGLDTISVNISSFESIFNVLNFKLGDKTILELLEEGKINLVFNLVGVYRRTSGLLSKFEVDEYGDIVFDEETGDPILSEYGELLQRIISKSNGLLKGLEIEDIEKYLSENNKEFSEELYELKKLKKQQILVYLQTLEFLLRLSYNHNLFICRGKNDFIEEIKKIKLKGISQTLDLILKKVFGNMAVQFYATSFSSIIHDTISQFGADSSGVIFLSSLIDNYRDLPESLGINPINTAIVVPDDSNTKKQTLESRVQKVDICSMVVYSKGKIQVYDLKETKKAIN
ncbi:MAG: hypothetical protein PHE25_00230 [Candidatus Gracilibacteria bacterium]|nr:hypothetical protein [Candidatus Gracilibacteria bacterium]